MKDDVIKISSEVWHDRFRSLSDRMALGWDYLMTVPKDKITVEDTLEAFGWNRNGYEK